MESSVHLLKSTHRHLHLSHSHHLLQRRTLHSIPRTSFSSFTHPPNRTINLLYNHHSNPIFNSHIQIPNSITTQFSNFNFNNSISSYHFASIFSNPNNELFKWHYADVGGEKCQRNGVLTSKEPVVTAVLLGWLGGKRKHLRKYVELYNSKGVDCITFVASVGDVLSFDLGRKLEERVGCLADELANWVSKSGDDGRERMLVFHTFSNTGWLTYGAILDNLGRRQGFLEKIKGCIVDSGGDPNIDPKVWAAGFTAALLKKRSSFVYPSVEAGEGKEIEGRVSVSNVQEKEPALMETLLFSAFEKLFSFLLGLPDIKQRLIKVIYALKNQPLCPQLYLYSTADKVIPFESVESFIKEQRRTGRQVLSHNFVSSPHVDHFRTFPNVYVSQVESFLKECQLAVEK